MKYNKIKQIANYTQHKVEKNFVFSFGNSYNYLRSNSDFYSSGLPTNSPSEQQFFGSFDVW